MEQLDDLLNKYFEGETTGEEEQQLRAYFASDEVREDLKKYRPLFAYFSEEIEKGRDKRANDDELPVGSPRVVNGRRRTLSVLLGGVAASIAILLGVARYYSGDTRFCGENYVVINGRCYTDINKVRSSALEALQEVAGTDEAFFPDFSEEDLKGKQLIDDQLGEFSDLINEE